MPVSVTTLGPVAHSVEAVGAWGLLTTLIGTRIFSRTCDVVPQRDTTYTALETTQCHRDTTYTALETTQCHRDTTYTAL